MECIELNWLYKHMEKIISSQPAIPVLNWVKHQSFLVSIANSFFIRYCLVEKWGVTPHCFYCDSLALRKISLGNFNKIFRNVLVKKSKNKKKTWLLKWTWFSRFTSILKELKNFRSSISIFRILSNVKDRAFCEKFRFLVLHLTYFTGFWIRLWLKVVFKN